MLRPKRFAMNFQPFINTFKYTRRRDEKKNCARRFDFCLLFQLMDRIQDINGRKRIVRPNIFLYIINYPNTTENRQRRPDALHPYLSKYTWTHSIRRLYFITSLKIIYTTSSRKLSPPTFKKYSLIIFITQQIIIRITSSLFGFF